MVSIDPSGFPVYERNGDAQTFWLRTPTSTIAVQDPQERDRIIARRWPSGAPRSDESVSAAGP